MSHYWSDNVHTTAFTPRDYQVELLAAAIEKNVMICLGHNSSKEFIVLKLLQEISPYLRKSNNYEDNKIAIYITYKSNGESIYNLIYHLTDLKVYKYVINKEEDEEEIPNYENDIKNNNYQIYIFDLFTFEIFLFEKKLNPKNLILIIEDCHEFEQQQYIVEWKFSDINPRKFLKILGLAGPLHNAECSLNQLKATLQIFEENIHCKAETASDIVTVLRYCTRPSEYILQCAPPKYDELIMYLEETITTRLAFLNDHRFDPSEIYSDEFLDELKAIPDPKLEPKKFLEDYLEILYEMGPWCADRAALMLLSQIEKQKVKTPYERHFLLLCMVSTTLVQIRAYCDYLFHKISNEKERVEKYSSPKVLRLLQVLRYFKPDEYGTENKKLAKISEDIDSLDFQKLQINLENTYENIENKCESKEINNIIENLESILHKNNEENNKNETIKTTKSTEIAVDKKNSVQKINCNNTIKDTSNEMTTTPKIRNTLNQRHKRKHFMQANRNKHYYYHHHHHHHNHNQNESDSLCGIIFCNCKNTAKILFDLLCEMSRHDPDLSFLSVQYTVDRVADPITESKEAELEHRRQEEVLKRFRMHECNLLIGTSVLEEGIDLPKCNLVIRWDQPTSYRSYVQCKGRARAPQAFHIILVAPKLRINLNAYNNEILSDRSHRFLCSTDDNLEQTEIETKTITTEIAVANNLSTLENDCCNKIENNEKLENNKEIEYENSIKEKEEQTENKPSLENVNGQYNDEQNEIKQNKQKNGFIKKSSDENCSKIELIEDLLDSSMESFSISETITEKTINTSIDNDSLNLTNNVSIDTNHHHNHISHENQNENEDETKVNDTMEKFECVVKNLEILNVENSFKNNLKVMEDKTNEMIEQIAQYREIEKLLLEKCANSEPSEIENIDADKYVSCIEPYKPLPDLLTGANVDLGGAISLINKYCAKLPSDTFTKLTPLWRCAKTTRNGVDLYQYTLRLPINSPLKHDILGLPMPTRVLARRMAALIACRELHKYGELDDKLQPIGKEGFKASEPDWEDFELEKLDEQIVNENSEPRPGTTKRRQYYYKKIASEFSNCRPTVGTESYLYLINMTLQCPIPEEQNTRGRKIYPPEDATQGFGILTLKKIPKVSAFPIFTRSGEVKVSIELSKDKYILTEKQIDRINIFVNYTFTNVLRLQKFLMLFDSEATENCIYIVPTIKTVKDVTIDWDFLELIYNNSDKMPKPISDEIRKNLIFDPEKFKDAVVMPWYRNQDQPQYFYVAEICYHLSPESCFPGENYSTFQQYYYLKYGITIQNSKQPLLDVDHTSARLNFLTPRYVNRKGVALPTSSEETKRAKRENLEQKQILVPELCTIHPFPASLWRAAVCLPCILYRINGLLLADEIRKKVSYDLGLGKMEIEDENFEWPILDFGWSLSEVLKKSKEAKETKQNTNRSSNCSQKSDHDDDNDNGNDNEKNENENETKDNINDNMIGQNSQKEKEKINEEIKIDEEIKIEKTANDLLEEADEKLKNDILTDIGTWSNDMADNIDSDKEFDGEEDWGLLPPEVNLCSRNKTNIRYGSPTSWDVGQSSNTNNPIDAYYTDSDASFQSDDDYDIISMNSNDDNDYESGRLHIEFKSNNVAEAIETEEEQLKRQKQLAILNDTCVNEKLYQNTKNIKSGYSFHVIGKSLSEKLEPFIDEFIKSTENIKKDIEKSGMLIPYNEKIELKKKKIITPELLFSNLKSFHKLIPYLNENEIEKYFKDKKNIHIRNDNYKLTIDDIIELNRIYLNKMQIKYEKYIICGVGDIFDNFIDYETLNYENDQKTVHINYEIKLNIDNEIKEIQKINTNKENDNKNIPMELSTLSSSSSSSLQSTSLSSLENKLENFSFDYQPNLIGHPGPSPSIILQALTMSNANDGINLERLETIGDSFLKYAITTYLYCKYEDVHEGKLSHLRSKQVSNLNLYRLGRKKVFGECMIATKFEPHDNWLPPCYYVPKELEKALIEARIPPCHWNLADLPNIKELSSEKICELVKKKAEALGLLDDDELEEIINPPKQTEVGDNFPCFIPYNLVTQHSIPDKSVADCVEALIGAYLIECGPRGALLFMAWLGIRVLPIFEKVYDPNESRIPGSTQPNPNNNNKIIIYGEWTPPKSPLLKFLPNPYKQLNYLLDGFDKFENNIGYHFKDRSYLLQAMTHASYSPNRLTDCYQRLEFLGDAVLDYLITRHLYEDPRQHSPGALTDLRSALVNNTIFASLAVRHGFHKYFKHLSPGLNEVIDRFVRIQHENGHSISEEYYLLSEEECDDAEDVEVPKALGDVFESVAGAIFLDSNMSLDAVWKVYSNMMRPEIEQFSNSVPKSPIRELLELEPETAKFGKPEKLADGRRVRVTVEVFGKGTFRGIGRNYRIAKCTAAKCALRQLKKQGLISKKH